MESKIEFRVKQLSSQDIDLFRELIFVFEDVFEMQNFTIPGTEHLRDLLDKPGFMSFAAVSGKKVIGGLTAYVLTSYYRESPDVYILDLAVKTEFQRQGVGKKLMEAIFAYCKKENMHEVFVQADEIDQHAVDFYHALGGISEKAINFDYLLSENK